VERCGSAGCRVLDADAVRAETMEGDDDDRALASAEIVRGLAAEVGPATPLRHPLRSRSVIGAVSDEIATDVSLRGTGLIEMAGLLATPRPVEVAVLPGIRNPESGQLLVPPERAAVLFQHLQQGTPLEGDPELEEQALLPEDIVVGVLNGTGTAGFAGRIESQLESAGFDVAGTDNATSFDHAQTVVLYDAGEPDAEVAAILVAEQLEGASLQASESPLSVDGDRVHVQITIGADLDDGDDGDDGDEDDA
jgi:hypothetical protein